MTWTCDKEDDCENGEDETHCSERQGGESKGLGGCCMGWQEQAQQRGKQEPLLSPRSLGQEPDSRFFLFVVLFHKHRLNRDQNKCPCMFLCSADACIRSDFKGAHLQLI